MFVYSIRPECEPASGSRFIIVRAEDALEAMELAGRCGSTWTFEPGVICELAKGGGFSNEGPKGIVFPFQSLSLKRTAYASERA